MRTVRNTTRIAAAAALSLAASVARAGGDSGTSAMGEMNISGAQLGMMVGALVGLGGVVWALAKFLNK
jgi:hypothetical protein